MAGTCDDVGAGNCIANTISTSGGGGINISALTPYSNGIINIVNNVLVPVLFALAFIVFLWGAFQTFILGANSEDVKEKGKSLMLWGLIGFFVMVSVWGLVNILTGTVGFSSTSGVTGGTPKAGVQIGG